MDFTTDEIAKLRRATRDMIAISSLSSIWTYYDVPQVADSLAETIYRCLFLDFAYVKITGVHQQFSTAIARTGVLKGKALENLNLLIDPFAEPAKLKARTCLMPNPFGEGQVLVNFAPIGYNFKNGYLVSASSRPHFPIESDRLILNIATNQTNVTIEHKWSQRLAEIARAEAINANELKSSFLANMSHEIRTPLGAILGFTNILKSSTLTAEERHQYLEIITRSGQSLTKIIDDILDLSKIEAGKLVIEMAPLSLSELCKEVAAMFSDRAASKGIALHVDDSAFPNFKISSDQVRIRQVLINLVGNAVKFTSHGQILIDGTYTLIADEVVKVSIKVTDTGVGISESVAASLFKPFIQGDNTSTRKFGGTGLGLALSKKLGHALGGDVLLTQCEVNKGCTFTFEFIAPRSEVVSDVPTDEKTENSQSKERLRGLRVLVADDQPDNQLLMRVILKREGALVEFANDGEEAVNKCLQSEFDAVLMDIQMPNLDGFGALAKLRAKNFSKPVFALTAHAMKEDRSRAIASGFVDHIPKPVNPKELVDSILLHARVQRANL